MNNFEHKLYIETTSDVAKLIQYRHDNEIGSTVAWTHYTIHIHNENPDLATLSQNIYELDDTHAILFDPIKDVVFSEHDNENIKLCLRTTVRAASARLGSIFDCNPLYTPEDFAKYPDKSISIFPLIYLYGTLGEWSEALKKLFNPSDLITLSCTTTSTINNFPSSNLFTLIRILNYLQKNKGINYNSYGQK